MSLVHDSDLGLKRPLPQSASPKRGEDDKRQSSFTYEELLTYADGSRPSVPSLPAPPLLMFDRITEVSDKAGEHGRGYIQAELDIKPDLWFFKPHFVGNPIMPGCLGLDALWQLSGFFLAWKGALGHGMATEIEGPIKFMRTIRPINRLVSYRIDVRQWRVGKVSMCVADGVVYCDDERCYVATKIKVVVAPEAA